MVIAADGRYSRVGRAIGLSHSAPHPRRWAIGAYFQDVEELGTFGEMHVRRGRYIGVAPLPDGLANACAVAPGIPGGTPAAFLRHALSSDPILCERFATARMVGSVVTLGPLGVDCTGAGAPGLLLAGDAAGFVDPMTGDGLRFAFAAASSPHSKRWTRCRPGRSRMHTFASPRRARGSSRRSGGSTGRSDCWSRIRPRCVRPDTPPRWRRRCFGVPSNTPATSTPHDRSLAATAAPARTHPRQERALGMH